MHRCLFCYKPLMEGEKDFHSHCTKTFFGINEAPVLPYTRKNLNELATIVVSSHTTVTGIQAKLSMDIEHDNTGRPQRLTIVGVMGGKYILKPQTEQFEHLPEVEDLTMHLADIAGIATVPHSLIRFKDGELNYITRRIDRTSDGRKLPMEDICQLSGKLTEQKYQGSHEMITTIIKKYSSAPRLDIVNYWEQVIFSWIVGNADMHLKNFSLIGDGSGTYSLARAYDQVSTKLVMPEDTDELALPVNGFQKKILPMDLAQAMEATGVQGKVIERIMKRFAGLFDKWNKCIDASFITDTQKEAYKTIIKRHIDSLANYLLV